MWWTVQIVVLYYQFSGARKPKLVNLLTPTCWPPHSGGSFIDVCLGLLDAGLAGDHRLNVLVPNTPLTCAQRTTSWKHSQLLHIFSGLVLRKWVSELVSLYICIFFQWHWAMATQKHLCTQPRIHTLQGPHDSDNAVLNDNDSIAILKAKCSWC